jgi:hypothetical protein
MVRKSYWSAKSNELPTDLLAHMTHMTHLTDMTYLI